MHSSTSRNRPLRQLILRLVWAFAGAALFLGAPVLAQTRDVEPYHVVTTGDSVYLRSGPGSVWYAVGYANTGDVLRVDGEEFKWRRVLYPAGTPALVSIEEADYIKDRGVVVITRPTRLKANNIQGQRLGDSWKNLTFQPINPGAELKYVDTIRDASGRAEGYLVAAPSEAHAFINEQYVRRATPSEVEAFLAAQRAARDRANGATPVALPALPTTTLPGAPTADAPASSRLPHTPNEPAPLSPSASQSNADASIPESVTKPDTAQPKPVNTEAALPHAQSASSEKPTIAGGGTSAPPIAEHTLPVRSDPVADLPAAIPTSEPAPPVTETVATEPQTRPTLTELESAFAALAELPIEDAELEPLIAEYKRFQSNLSDAEATRSMLARLENRLTLLQLRLTLQENLRELHAAEVRASADAEALSTSLAQFERARPYLLVGRLSTSTIYNGERLPLMYRLQSVEVGGARTIAYLVPTPGIDFNGKLGGIVGVEGVSRIDPALKLRIITPARVDTLTSALTRVEETSEQP